MRHAIIHGLAQAAVVFAAFSAVQAAKAQTLIPVRGASVVESFAPATGIAGAVPNYAAYGLNSVQVSNGVPMGGVAGPLADASRDALPFATTVVSRSSAPERVSAVRARRLRRARAACFDAAAAVRDAP